MSAYSPSPGDKKEGYHASDDDGDDDEPSPTPSGDSDDGPALAPGKGSPSPPPTESAPSPSGKNEKVGHFTLGKLLGAGSFAKVKLATHAITGHTVAVKIFNKARLQQQGMKERVEREIRILQQLGRHPHISHLYDVIESPRDIYLVLENHPGGELYDFLTERGALSEDHARTLFQQLVAGIDYCHQHGIFHRDLKPENILLDVHHNIQIADFGLSKMVGNNHESRALKTACGSPNYAAPEIISGEAYSGPAVDVWSCGCILYALLCGYVPFEDESTPRLFEKIKSGKYEMPPHVSEEARDLISRILQVDPEKRITISEIRTHPWFQVHNPPQPVEPRVDPEVVDKVAQLMPAKKEQVEEAASLEDTHEAPKFLRELKCTYELILDHKRKKHERDVCKKKDKHKKQERESSKKDVSPKKDKGRRRWPTMPCGRGIQSVAATFCRSPRHKTA